MRFFSLPENPAFGTEVDDFSNQPVTVIIIWLYHGTKSGSSGVYKFKIF